MLEQKRPAEKMASGDNMDKPPTDPPKPPPASKPNEFTGHWFWGPVLACRHIYGQVIAASVLINLFALASSLYIMTIYDRVIPNYPIRLLRAYGG
ncbi:MAG: hypothetical protein OXT03_03555 [Alphaproteobacteria bacterium]|nr:hypothetical protein [Alphaproteobacteria bacterium]